MKKSLAIAILNLQKEMNVGSIVRTGNAANIEEIIIIGRKKWNKSAATGAQYKTPIRLIKTTDEFLEYCTKNDYHIVSLEISDKSEQIFDYEYPQKTMLVVGNEGNGVPGRILSASKSIVRIPQYGNMECLNVAVSAGIAIYDWTRKNQFSEEKKIEGNKFEHRIKE